MNESFFIRMPELDFTTEQKNLWFTHLQSVANENISYLDFSGKYDGNILNRNVPLNLDIRFTDLINKIPFEISVYFLIQSPNTKLLPHKDDTRNCVINIPIQNIQNSPTQWFHKEPPDPHAAVADCLTNYNGQTYMINTQQWHAVSNSSHKDRIMLQTEIFATYAEALTIYKKGLLFK